MARCGSTAEHGPHVFGRSFCAGNRGVVSPDDPTMGGIIPAEHPVPAWVRRNVRPELPRRAIKDLTY